MSWLWDFTLIPDRACKLSAINCYVVLPTARSCLVIEQVFLWVSFVVLLGFCCCCCECVCVCVCMCVCVCVCFI